ncbi:hypothetical protein CA12_38700 [Alienimonas californiensis]|uniref:Uncharacterized protein n=2 Tax=Alienimonas californiensis TaxID=2527989 RepID=A0A517PEF0_9PLAN|nr:hypothetical protein CA12_38700 [Alienimonas californiensis]
MTPRELGSFWGVYAGCCPVWLAPLLPAAWEGRVDPADGLAALAVAGIWSLLWALCVSAPLCWTVNRWMLRTGRDDSRGGGIAFAVGLLSGVVTAAVPTLFVVYMSVIN